LGPALIGAG